ncbi:MAG: type II toxin-antitoxin system HicB family antitoxin [Tannerella sp.]|jgi:predicted RNase H-like HicB family nuclease|nr:type II toxin-antitoxin system HicB family antitoxin [Tannerella sp.]
MEKIVVTVELSENNYSAFLEDLPGCVSTGKSFDDLKKNIREAVEFHLDGMREDGDEIPEQFIKEYQLVFRFDPQSLLHHYNDIFTNAALERITGINQRQLQRYASGASRPRRPQAEKIEKALHKLGKELLAVEL